jgi:hypothetical protein
VRDVRLFDHVVGERQYVFGESEPERFRGPEIDHELEGGRLQATLGSRKMERRWVSAQAWTRSSFCGGVVGQISDGLLGNKNADAFLYSTGWNVPANTRSTRSFMVGYLVSGWIARIGILGPDRRIFGWLGALFSSSSCFKSGS